MAPETLVLVGSEGSEGATDELCEQGLAQFQPLLLTTDGNTRADQRTDTCSREEASELYYWLSKLHSMLSFSNHEVTNLHHVT